MLYLCTVSSKSDYWLDIIESTEETMAVILINIISKFAGEGTGGGGVGDISICEDKGNNNTDRRGSTWIPIQLTNIMNADKERFIKEFEHEKSMLQSKNLELLSENEDLKVQIYSHEKHIKALDCKLSDSTNEIDKLKKNITILTEENSKIKVDYKQKIDNLDKELVIKKV